MAVAAEDYCRGSKLWCKPFRWKTIAVMTVAVMVVVADDCRGNALLGIVLVHPVGLYQLDQDIRHQVALLYSGL